MRAEEVPLNFTHTRKEQWLAAQGDWRHIPTRKRGHGAYCVPCWRWLTPEIGRALRDHAWRRERHSLLWVSRWKSPWYMAWGPHTFCYEFYSQEPNPAHSIFRAQAWITRVPAAELTRYADEPRCKADLYYIEKLVAANQAHGKLRWAQPPDPASARDEATTRNPMQKLRLAGKA